MTSSRLTSSHIRRRSFSIQQKKKQICSDASKLKKNIKHSGGFIVRICKLFIQENSRHFAHFAAELWRPMQGHDSIYVCFANKNAIPVYNGCI